MNSPLYCFSSHAALSRVSQNCSFWAGASVSPKRPRFYSLTARSRQNSLHLTPVARADRAPPRGSPPGITGRRYSSPIRPKQSLGQNFLQDQNIIRKIVSAFDDALQKLSPDAQVLEIGAGTGALSSELIKTHPRMLAVEIDWRAVDVLREEHPSLDVLQGDVLEVDWNALSTERDAPLAVIGNLPYNIVSQILLSMLEARRGAISFALVMMQKEVAERICARTRTKSYGILSVVSQLYAKPVLLFDVPNTAFYPKPSITSTMVLFKFESDPCFDISNSALTGALRNVVRAAFQQRRKTMRNSLRALCNNVGVELGDTWSAKRPEEITPQQFVELTEQIFEGKLGTEPASESPTSGDPEPVWRPRTR